MTIRNKLTITFTIVVVSLLVLFSIIVYYFSANNRETNFYLRLRSKCITTARLLIRTEGFNSDLLKTIDKNTVLLQSQRSIAIFNNSNIEIYNNGENASSSEISTDLINQIRQEGEVHFKNGQREGIGIVFNHDQEKFVVVASAIDEYGLSSLHDLKIILLVGLLVISCIIILAGLIFSGQALKPISAMITQMNDISANNLNLRLSEGNGKDEIATLANRFNKMIERLEASFDMQSKFVSNASHELRTPLTAVSGQIEIALMNKRSAEEYEKILQSIWEDIINMKKLSNGLLDLVQASLDISKIKFKPIRIDEILWQARVELIKIQKEYIINIEYTELPEDEKKLTLKANEQLLKTAILNLMDNACKYSSNKQAIVNIGFNNNSILLNFIDNGIGIPKEEQKHIFENFYRAANAKGFAGHGIGLSLTSKIMNLHQGSISFVSELNKGTTFTIALPLENEA